MSAFLAEDFTMPIVSALTGFASLQTWQPSTQSAVMSAHVMGGATTVAAGEMSSVLPMQSNNGVRCLVEEEETQ